MPRLPWAAAALFSLLTLAYALRHGWTARDLVWSFWLVTFTAGIAVPAGLTLVWALLAAAHPRFERRHWRAFAAFIVALVAVYTLFFGLAHRFFLEFVAGFVPPLHENVRIEEIRRGVPVLALSENALEWWWRNLAATWRAYWPFAALTLLADALSWPRTRDGWLAQNPLCLFDGIGGRIARLMSVQALLLLAWMLGLRGESALFALLFLAIHFLPAGFFGALPGRRQHEPADRAGERH